ncbi:MAG: aminopeptidase P family protein [Methanobacteriota archaeon]|nr:MAG: aminopeptidase P family protein [Euryarchaeota archaeon]
MDVPREELESRWTAAQEVMSKEEWDALLIPLGVNFQYFFGKPGNPSERFLCGIIPAEGDPFLLTPAFERSNFAQATGIEDIIVWEETESPYRNLIKELDERKIGSNVGVDPKLWIIEVERLSRNTNRSFKSAGAVIDSLRLVKSDWEIEQLKAAARASAEGILATFDRLKEGMTEKEVVPILNEELGTRSGNPITYALVQFGPNSALPHGYPTDRKLKSGDVVLLDVGTNVNGYQGDITITKPFGSPPDQFREIYDIVFEANRKAFEANREGAIPAELDKIARSHIESAGYGKYFTHRLGHGLGLEVHEHPYLVGTNQTPLIGGSAHTIEPGIYIEGKFGVRIEDDVYVTKNGCKRLFDVPRYTWE